MKNNLPNNWVAVKLGSIVKELNSGFACGVHNSTGDGIAHLRPMNVTSKGVISLKDLRSVSAAAYDKLVKGDVLFNNTNSTELVGKTAYIEEDTDWGYSNHMTRLRFDPTLINSKFVSYYLHNLFYAGYFRANCNNHVSQASISAKFLANEVMIPLPPFTEQNRIVAQLEATMQKLEASQERLENLPALLKKFRQAVLAAAVSGKLTEAWRTEQLQGETGADLLNHIRAERRAQWEDKQQAKLSGKQLSLNDSWKSKYKEPAAPDTSELPELPEEWVWTTMPMVGELNRGKSKHRPRNDEALYGGPYPFIQTGDVSRANRTIDSYKQTYSELGLEQSKLWAKGTLCITIAANIADTAILGFDACFPDSIVGFLANPNRIEIDFVEFFLSTAKANIEHYAPATAQKNINLDILSQVAMPLPSYTEQQEIVRQVNHYFELADQLEARFEQAAALVEQLPQALLTKAFSGQLVPQDPNDEPANVLLERLAAEAPAPANGKRGRKTAVTANASLFD